MLRLFGEGKKQISRRMRRLTADGTYHMVEFTAARVDELGEKECWCILVFRDIQDEFLQEQQRNLGNHTACHSGRVCISDAHIH